MYKILFSILILVIALSCSTVSSYDKSVLWLGTSIPNGASYPCTACNNVSVGCIDRTIPASKLTCDSAGADSYYLKLLQPFVYHVDYVVIDHGFNDRLNIHEMLAEGEDSIDWTSRDCSNFVGAFNRIVDMIHTFNPKAKIIIGGYFQNTLDYLDYYSNDICYMQELMSRKLGYKLLDTWKRIDFGGEYVPNSSGYLNNFNKRYGKNYKSIKTDSAGNITRFQMRCPDGVHPYTDKTGLSDKILDSVYTVMLKDVITLTTDTE